MFSTTGEKQHGQVAWRDFIVGKAKFYISNPTQMRSEPEFPWAILDTPIPRDVPNEKARLAEENLRGAQQAALKAFLAASKEIWAARHVFEDELSRQIYDEAICLRIARHRHFIGPRIHFDRVMKTVASKPFSAPDFPSNYLGIPLVEIEARLRLARGTIELSLIAPEHFDDWFNFYRQYFQSRNGMDVLPVEGDVVFDCGSCVGEYSTLFAGFAGLTGQVYAFDPFPLHARFVNLQHSRNMGRVAPITTITAAVGNENIEQASGEVEDTSQISPSGLQSSQFEMVRLDNFVAERGIDRVDFIKMDVESFEPDALIGATGLVQRFKPKLAISIYHTWEQFWSIPLQIKEMCPEYRLFLGHHSPTLAETVVYACCPAGSEKKSIFQRLVAR